MNHNTVRFKAHLNGGEVKLELAPGETITHTEYAPHDEGYNRTVLVFEYDDGVVFRTIHCEGRDCDGYTATTHEHYCHPHRLRNEVHRRQVGWTRDEDGWREAVWGPDPGWPAWAELSARHHDEYAEAAGY